jgi:hypothetical protein
MSEIGKHLLGRIPSPPDTRDYKLKNFEGLGVSVSAAPVDPVYEIAQAGEHLSKTTVTFRRWAATDYPDITATHWWKALNHLQNALDVLEPVPPPVPPPTVDMVLWTKDDPTLDQGNTPHCVGFSAAQWANTLPVDGEYRNEDGHALYYECKVIDGDPGAENGSFMRSAGEALLARERLSVYAFASSVEEIKTFVRQKGPVLVGTNWYEDMFDPDSQGFVTPTGGVAGGHAYLLCGDAPTEDAFIFLNSWDAGWGQGGYFKIKYDDFATLLADFGEAVVAVELPL